MQFIPSISPKSTNFYVAEGLQRAPTITSTCKKFEGHISYFNLSWAPQFIKDYINSFYTNKVDFEYCRIYDIDWRNNDTCSTAINALMERNFPPFQTTRFKEFYDAFKFSRKDEWGFDSSTSRLSALYASCSLTDQEIEAQFRKVVAGEKDAFSPAGLQRVLVISSVALIAFLLYKCYKKKWANPIKVGGDSTPLPKAIEVIQSSKPKQPAEPGTGPENAPGNLRDQKALKTAELVPEKTDSSSCFGIEQTAI